MAHTRNSVNTSEPQSMSLRWQIIASRLLYFDINPFLQVDAYGAILLTRNHTPQPRITNTPLPIISTLWHSQK